MVKYLLNHFIKVLFFLFAVSGCRDLFAQANFIAICPKKKIGKNDVLQVEFRLQNASDIQDIEPPEFKDFSVVSGPNQATSTSNFNGKIDQFVSVSFILKPNGPGDHTIARASAKADGKEFYTDPIRIQVTNSSAVSPSSGNLANSMPPLNNFNFDISDEPTNQQYDDYILKKGENVNDKIKKNLFIRADVSKTSCYVGEPIVVTFKIYTRLRLETSIQSEPSFNGFSVSEMDLNNRNSAFQEKLNGRDYNVYVLRKVQLFPLQAGSVTLDPLVTDNNVTFIKADYIASQSSNPFLDMMQNFANAMPQPGGTVQEHITLQSKPVIINVKPLPDSGKPSYYKGAVGNFSVRCSLGKNKFTTDDAGNLKVEIGGSGNIQMINAPKITWPGGVDGYDAKVADTVDKNATPLKGNKTFTYPFTISKAGTYTIPPVAFSYFNPESRQYKKMVTDSFTVVVTTGKGIHGSPLVNTVVAENSPTTWSTIKKYSMFFTGGIALLGAILFAGFKKNNKNSGSIAEVRGQTQSSETGKEEQEPVLRVSPLEEAHQKLQEGNSHAFYHTLDGSLKKYLGGKFNLPLNELTRKRIADELDKRGVGLGTSLRLSSLLESIELNLYAPPSALDVMSDTYDKAAEIIFLLDKQC